MSLLTEAELMRIRAELFDNLLDIGAVPMIDIHVVYTSVIQPNLSSSSVAPTTCSTAVTAAGPATLTLGSVAGLSAVSSRVVIDVDASREVCTVRAISGSTIDVICKQTHSGTYPVEVESGLTIARGIIADLESLDQVQRANVASAGVKKVDEIEFFSASEGGSILVQAENFRNVLRGRLAAALGVTGLLRNLAARVSSGSPALEVY